MYRRKIEDILLKWKETPNHNKHLLQQQIEASHTTYVAEMPQDYIYPI